jgi:peptide-methionine (S)-S-oxide reductase
MKTLTVLVLITLLNVLNMESQVYQSDKYLEKATLGGGCFWCLEAVFDQVDGVTEVISGYAGGSVVNPSYQEVCSGNTGHAEVVQITYDPLKVSYSQLLDIFFAIHDPTTLNRQGADVGSQYRSVIFYHSPQQQAVANSKIAEVAKSDEYDGKIVTEVMPLPTFYKAEGYHQDYFAKHPEQPYCEIVISPKVAKFKTEFKKK